MAYQITPILLANALVFVLVVGLGGYGALQYHRRGHKSELLAFVVLMGAIAVWELGSIFAGVTTTAELKMLGVNMGNALGVLPMTYAFLWFALAYTDTEGWVHRWTVGYVGFLTATVCAILLLDPAFMFDGTLVTRGPVTVLGLMFDEWVALDRTFRTPFHLFQLHAYVVLFAGSAVLARYLVRNRSDLSNGQAAALAVAVGTPTLVNSLLFAGLLPPELNLTEMAMGVTGVGFAVAIFRYRLLGLAPVGRQQLVNSMDDPVVMLDDAGRVVDCNPAARSLVDAPVEWRGMAGADFFSPFPEQVERFRDTTDAEAEVSTTTGGEERTFHLNISPIHTDAGGRAGQLIVLRDITAQNERRRQLERQNERLDQFADVVSHDLRNPLTVASGRLELLRDDPREEHIDAIEGTVERMETMVEDLRTIAAAGQTVEETRPISLAESAREAWGYAQTGECTVDVAADDPVTVQADRDRLLHIFENVYRNAADHNDDPVTVRVGLLDGSPATDGGHRTGFFIEDDGDGIPAADRDAVFEQGYTTAGDGTGVGLAIARDMAENHGWDIQVTDGADGGARFEITGVDLTE
ncbi:histidine kinase N-terminal 7TM domain-containing protein [Haloarcula rara]|uniref:histidine kinase N-terminal 7TM domain-containing protein n=1 Tax=Haloarcula rara TaxID=3033387 RepID=UPI0023E8D774|nr:histidine kinase N-terminal 7TM domain-containing protein [Halomicroarcula sp. SHR3]